MLDYQPALLTAAGVSTLVNNEGRRGFSGVNPPNPSGKYNTEASVVGRPRCFVPFLTPTGMKGFGV